LGKLIALFEALEKGIEGDCQRFDDQPTISLIPHVVPPLHLKALRFAPGRPSCLRRATFSLHLKVFRCAPGEGFMSDDVAISILIRSQDATIIYLSG